MDVLFKGGAQLTKASVARASEHSNARAMMRALLVSGATDRVPWNDAFFEACWDNKVPTVRALMEVCQPYGVLDLEEALAQAVKHDCAIDVVQALLDAGAPLQEVSGLYELRRYAGQPGDPTRKALEAAGMDFRTVDAASPSPASTP